MSEEKQNSQQSSTQRVYQEIRSDILTIRRVPGERLKIDSIKEELGTGASPIREALSLLTSDQLVDRLDQRGFRVAKTSRSQFLEILELRCNLETLALRRCLATQCKDWENELVLAHHHMNRSNIRNDGQFEFNHKKFHMALLSACQSPILIRFCDQLYDLNIRYRHLARQTKEYSQRDIDAEHLAIFNAAIRHDADTACARLTEHYQKTGDFLALMID